MDPDDELVNYGAERGWTIIDYGLLPTAEWTFGHMPTWRLAAERGGQRIEYTWFGARSRSDANARLVAAMRELDEGGA